jgi:DNA-binding transcriptional MerR regulator
MPRIRVGSQYYTAKEVKEKLGLTQGELNTYIRNGTLRPETPPGKKQGVYKRSHVDQLVREKQAFMGLPQKTFSVFSKASKEETREAVEMARELLGRREGSETTEAWPENTHAVCYIVKVDGEMAGYALLLPVDLEQMRKLLQHEEFAVETDAGDDEA